MKNDKRAHSDLPGIAINFFRGTPPSASAPEVAGFASPLMVAVSHPAAAISGGFTSPWMTPLPLLYSSFKKQLAT
ncbi:hypothetical protein BFJ68_g763 [Fusarium oxysporum]|uniref:Uncharacterized protein n=1 Tax=Fusarium oxysporum TaxID=5507 RepID=A0A420S681_FUSOX|nr:hypothetical protein BFJ68_g763 [Fusarium oxysporum]